VSLTGSHGTSPAVHLETSRLPARAVSRTAWHGNLATGGTRIIPEETPVAFTYNRTTHAIMLASPSDLADFAVGFSLTEGIIQRASDIVELETVPTGEGIELRMWLAPAHIDALTVRQRRLAGPSGCGLCGLQSFTDAVRQPPHVTADLRLTSGDIAAAMTATPSGQLLNQQTHAVHAAHIGGLAKAWWRCARMSDDTMRSTSSQVRSHTWTR